MPATPYLGITQLSVSQNSKEITINDAIMALEAAISSVRSVSYAASNEYTLTAKEATGHMVYRAVNASAAATLKFPIAVNGYPFNRTIVVRNESGHPLTVQFATGAGSTVTVPNGAARLIAGMTGTNFIVAAEPSSAVNFLDLEDAPGTFADMAGKVLVVNGAENALEFVDGLSFPDFAAKGGMVLVVNEEEDGVEWVEYSSTFLSLSDAPSSYTGQASKLVAVNGAGTGLEFIDTPTFEIVDYPAATRWRVRTLALPALITQAGWGEIELQDVDGIDLTGAGTASASTFATGREPTYSFDNLTSSANGWLSQAPDSVGSWIEYTFATPQVVRSIKLWAINGQENNAPTQFIVEHHNGDGWVSSGTRTPAAWTTGTPQTFAIRGIASGSISDAPSDGTYYARRNGAWVAIGESGEGNLGDLGDVDLSTPPTDGQVLTYHNASSKWVPQSPSGGAGDVEEAPEDGSLYARKDGEWEEIPEAPVEEAPEDGYNYVRRDGAWVLEGSGADVKHEYWRLKLLATDDPEMKYFTIVSELAFRATPTGPTLTTGGTPIASSEGSYVATNAFDGDTGTYWQNSDFIPLAQGDTWVGYQFAAPVSIVAFTLTTASYSGYKPTTGIVQFSDDGEAWEDAWDFTLDYTSGLTQTSVRPDSLVYEAPRDGKKYSRKDGGWEEESVGNAPKAAPYGEFTEWRLRCTEQSGGSARVLQIEHLEFRDVYGEIINPTGGTATGSANASGKVPSNVFLLDEYSIFETSGFFNSGSLYWNYAFAAPVGVAEVRFTADNAFNAPGRVYIEYKDGSTWTPAWDSGAGLSWVNNETKTFTSPDEGENKPHVRVYDQWVEVDIGGDAVGISGAVVTYQTHTSGTAAPSGSWLSSVPAVTKGEFLWTRTVTTYTDASTSTSYSVAYAGTDGTNGSAGSAGVGISGVVVTYQAAASATVAPSGTWLSSPPAVSQGEYLWTRTVLTLTNANTYTAYSVARQGVDGEGAGGIDDAPSDTLPYVRQGLDWEKLPFDLSFFIPVKPTASMVVFYHKFARKVQAPIALAGSKIKALTAATASSTWTIKKNGSSVGTLVWAAAGQTPTITFTTATTFDVDDELTIEADASQDATLAGVAAALLLERIA